MCGHILTINCGKNDLDVIINNSNYGGGLDLYESTWDRATTGRLLPGLILCSAVLSSKNAMNGNGPMCFYASEETNNKYFHKIALFNTGLRLVMGASLKGVEGRFQSNINPYFIFSTYAEKSELVTFRFDDGSNFSTSLSECKSGRDKKSWNYASEDLISSSSVFNLSDHNNVDEKMVEDNGEYGWGNDELQYTII